jgi:two-component system NtrC family sensor kinase
VLGMVGAQLVAHAWWWLPLMAVPFVSAYYGFRRSVEETVQKTRLAEELEKNLKELKETQAQLIQSAKLATVGTLAAGIAHEINNPLTVISARAELLLARLRNADQVDMEKVKAGIDDVYQMTGRISKIVSGLLSYSRRSESMTDIRLDELMDDSLPLLERKFEKKNVTLIKEYQRTPAVHVVANQLQQVFMNLVGNAIDAMPEWGTITLGCKEENGMAVAYVKDTGTGIPPAVLDRIFEPFFTTKEVGKGTGLGLFICHKIVSDHQGALSVESELGTGTTFWVKLPLVASSISEKSEKHEENESAAIAASYRQTE